MDKFTNQKELLLHIWETRPHISQVSGKPLLPISDLRWHHQFAHILSKVHYVSYKLNPDNIMLMLPEEHANQEQYDAFKNKKTILQREYYKNIYGKEFD